MDKNNIGASQFGFLHSFYELFGDVKASTIFTVISWIGIGFLKLKGFTCGIKDLFLNTKAWELRK